MTVTVVSPHGGSVKARQALSDRFCSRLSTNDFLNRRVVSYQGNRKTPGLRWMKYKEGFSGALVAHLIAQENPCAVLDPFAGMCTAPLIAAGLGRRATGIEIMPVGIRAGMALAQAANGLSRNDFDKHASDLKNAIRTEDSASGLAFPHVRITKGAFSDRTEQEIARARRFLANMRDEGVRAVLDLACMSVLEEASYTRKDGQYLRWDRRADRPLRASVDLGHISSFNAALERKIDEITTDFDRLREQFGGGRPSLVNGSCLELLKDIPDGEFDMVITSPPYANRYDYTRTYALELAWMGFGQDAFSDLRQKMLSATVENKTKRDALAEFYGTHREAFDRAVRMYDGQCAIREVLNILEDRRDELSNRNVLRLIEQYFFEMALVISELGRIVCPGGVVIMVNDNVQYHGEELPVDFILSDFAEMAGFRCSTIWHLARGKGNSSQQMARFGRQELRKCVYRWVRRDDG
ncbi:MAG: site-specific DNA-methyltransferase [Rhodobacteraceae bacterium]|nr:site-specific DNA-methyltransferase [Paracoccaceae bacterium]